MKLVPTIDDFSDRRLTETMAWINSVQLPATGFPHLRAIPELIYGFDENPNFEWGHHGIDNYIFDGHIDNFGVKVQSEIGAWPNGRAIEKRHYTGPLKAIRGTYPRGGTTLDDINLLNIPSYGQN